MKLGFFFFFFSSWMLFRIGNLKNSFLAHVVLDSGVVLMGDLCKFDSMQLCGSMN